MVRAFSNCYDDTNEDIIDESCDRPEREDHCKDARGKMIVLHKDDI